MIDTEDLTSYYPGYDEYCEPKEEKEDNSWELADIYYEEMMIRKEIEKMERKVIDLSTIIMEIKQIFQLENYIWKDKYLIPEEMYDDFIKSKIKKRGE